MIIGAHIMLQSTNEAADRKFFSDVLKLDSIDAGGGFMIFGVPPAEVALHASDENDVHKLYFMCENIARFTAAMTRHGIPFTTPQRQSWGTVTEITLPGGGALGVYQPHHKRPKHVIPEAAEKRAVRKPAARKAAKKAPAKRATRRKAKTKRRR
ncbi:MAG TPA: hypothetical protein VGI20_07770 [Rhizomicrobium sp.]|jgi:hypothetical protein